MEAEEWIVMIKKLLNEIDQLRSEIDAIKITDKYQLDLIKQYYKIGITYSSNAIEGNTLTESETKIVLEEGLTIGGKRLVDHLEAVGHSDAMNLMFALNDKKSISEEDIKELHFLFFSKINLECAGVYRNVKVFLTGSKYPLPHPDELQKLMADFIEKINGLYSELHPIEIAAIAHKDFVFIHPFIDGNGIVARLIMNVILLQNKFTPTYIPPILRGEYFNLLEKAHVSDEDFIIFIAKMVKESQKDYLRLFS